MVEVLPAEEQSNYETFRDCLSEPVLKALALPAEKPKPKKKRHAKKISKDKIFSAKQISALSESVDHGDSILQADAEDLGDFIEVLLPICFA